MRSAAVLNVVANREAVVGSSGAQVEYVHRVGYEVGSLPHRP